MEQHVIRLAQLASVKGRPGMLPVSQATVWRWVREGKFPKPFKLVGTTCWNLRQVQDFIAAQQGVSTQ